MVEFFLFFQTEDGTLFSNGLFHLITSYTQIIAVHYGVITNMAAIALIHLFIYECIISEFAPHSLSLNRKCDHCFFSPLIEHQARVKNCFRLFLEHIITRVNSVGWWLLWLLFRMISFLPSIFSVWLAFDVPSLYVCVYSIITTLTHSTHIHIE